MSEDNRGSSGGDTAMMVVAILGGLLVVSCCGGAVVVGLGGSFVWMRAAPAQMQAPPPVLMPAPQFNPEVQKAEDELKKDLEPLKIAPEDATTTPLEPGTEKPEVVPPPPADPPGTEAVPAPEEKKE